MPKKKSNAPSDLDQFALTHRAHQSGKCSFCSLPPLAHEQLQQILDKNKTGEYCMSVADAVEWFAAKFGFKRSRDALYQHVRRCLRRRWNA